MSSLSRRQLARYGADQLLTGTAARKVCRQLAAVLVATRRTSEAELLAEDIVYELEARGKLALARVTSARPISPSLRAQLIKAVKAAAKVETVTTEEITDKTLLGGMEIETALHSWDETIARRLNNLRGAA